MFVYHHFQKLPETSIDISILVCGCCVTEREHCAMKCHSRTWIMDSDMSKFPEINTYCLRINEQTIPSLNILVTLLASLVVT